MTDDEREAELERLFRLPPAEFTGARNALARRLAEQGDAGGAASFRALVKPSLPAWAVNQLYWSDREAFDALIESGKRVRRLQAAPGPPDELRTADRDRRAAVAAALGRIERLAARWGARIGESVRDRVRSTLEALSLLGSARPQEADGRLSRELEPPGFDHLLELAATARPLLPSPPAGASDSATTARAELGMKRRLAESARGALAELEQRAAGAQAELSEAERRLERARERAAEAAAAVRDARVRAEAAAAELAEAETTVDEEEPER